MAESFHVTTDAVRVLSCDEALRALGTGEGGLDAAEGAARQARYGKNLIEETKKTSPVVAFLKNFTHLMALLLWAAGAVALVAGMPELCVAVWLVNLVNGVFSFWQEYRASKATEALKKMLPTYATVMRGGVQQKVLAEYLVPGDVMLLSEGDKVSADARVIEASDLQVNQSALTGESNPVRKTADPVVEEGLASAEVPNLVFAGTSVSEGTGKAVVVSIGMGTEFGRIAGLTQGTEQTQSPLQRQLDRLTRQLTVFALCMGVAFFVLDVAFVHDGWAASFIFALGMVVAFIPEGLLPTVTLSLAMAVQRMSKKNALVKRLSSVEALGSTSVICTDKTGTLTQNEMTVNHLWTASADYDVSGVGYSAPGEVLRDGIASRAADDEDLRLLVTAGALCSNARLVPATDDPDKLVVLGDPTEACLLVSARKAGVDLEQEQSLAPRVRELPFESRRKRMSTIHQLRHPLDGARRVAFVKGAPSEMLGLCSRIRVGGQSVELTKGLRERVERANDGYARDGLRVLAVAYRPLRDDDASLPHALSDYEPDVIERDLTFVGLEVMQDPPRPEVAQAVETCRRAGIRVVMVTGDYGLTAVSIARKIGIVRGSHPRVLTGVDLERMSDDALREALADEVVFARMAPEQKLRVVENLQAMGQVVAVTGDGVNDAPALKKADVGVAMGVTGSDVAKEAADMILTDDNFASIVSAVEEGRAVYANIRKFMTYILNSNVPEAVPSALHLLSGGAIPLPLTTMQILTIDLGTDMLPALGLGCEPPEADVMSQPPRSQDEPLLDRTTMMRAFLWYGLMATALSVLTFFRAEVMGGWHPGMALLGVANDLDPAYVRATTMTLAAIVFCQIGQVWNCRSANGSAVANGLLSNRQIDCGIVAELGVLAAICLIPPLRTVFHTSPVGLQDLAYLCLLPFVVLTLDETRKSAARRGMARARDVASSDVQLEGGR